jgi:hypothetical protein
VLYLRAEPGDGAYGGESSVAALTLQGGRNMGGVLVGASCWIDATTIQLGSSGISSLIDLQAAETVAQGALVANGALTANSTLTVGDGVGAEVLAVNGGAGQVRDLRFNTAGSLRWIVRAENTAESGGNVGSNFAIVARDDSGNDLGAMLTLTRSDGAVVLGRSGGKHGFYGGAAVAKPTVSGSRGGNAALASLLTALDSLKLITNSTTA